LQAVAAAAGGAAQKTKRIQLRSAHKIIRHPGEGRDPPLYLRAVDLWIPALAGMTNGWIAMSFRSSPAPLRWRPL
jgi:hypothetical protein